MTRQIISLTALTLLLITGTSGVKWLTLPDPIVYSCVGATIVLPWNLSLSKNETLFEVKWVHNSTELVSAFINEQFLLGQKYENRIVRDQLSYSINITSAVATDQGPYTILVVVMTPDPFNSSGYILSDYFHTITVQVSDGLMVSGGQVRVWQDPVPQWNMYAKRWAIRLYCGEFTFMGKPPINVQWNLPNNMTELDSPFHSGRFALDISQKAIMEGTYTCLVPIEHYPHVCVNGTDPDPTTEANLKMDEMRTRMSLAELEQERLRKENEDFNAKMENLIKAMDIHKVLQDDIRKINEQLKEFCKCPLRLAGGNSSREGRVELRFGDTWGTICDDGWDDNDAAVICNMLGYFQAGAEARPGGAFGEGSGPIVMSNVKCRGEEYDVLNCPFLTSNINCDHTEDAGVACVAGPA